MTIVTIYVFKILLIWCCMYLLLFLFVSSFQNSHCTKAPGSRSMHRFLFIEFFI